MLRRRGGCSPPSRSWPWSVSSRLREAAAASQNGQQPPQNSCRRRRRLFDEGCEVEQGIAAGEVGQCADDQPGEAERLADLRDGPALHLDRLAAELRE